jgi:hypothetical protein
VIYRIIISYWGNVKSASGLVVKFIVAIDEPPVQFRAGALLFACSINYYFDMAGALAFAHQRSVLSQYPPFTCHLPERHQRFYHNSNSRYRNRNTTPHSIKHIYYISAARWLSPDLLLTLELRTGSFIPCLARHLVSGADSTLLSVVPIIPWYIFGSTNTQTHTSITRKDKRRRNVCNVADE